MNDLVKNSIECRKTALFNGYEITDEGLINKIEDLFERINQFGEGCIDNMDFEAKFATSELNQEYIQLFTEIVTKCAQKNSPSEPEEKPDNDNGVMDEVASDLRYEANELSMPVRRKVRQEVYDEARDMPIIGDAMYVKQHIDLLGKFGRLGKLGKKKKEKNDNEDADK